MKVLTLTFQFANNMGALLQCYALSRFLNNQEEIDCEVIQYYPSGWKNSWTIFHKPRTFRDVLKFIFELCNIKGYIQRHRKNSLTRSFISKYIPLTKEAYYSQESILNNPPKADVYICGSDQIWNFTLYNDLTYYFSFLQGRSGIKKIAYAASVADDWTIEQEKIVSPYLTSFDSLSIREYGNLEQVTRTAKKEVKVVIDPVFLLSIDDWNKISKPIEIVDPYILCYFLSVSDLAIKTVEKIRQLTGLKVVYLNHNSLDKFNSDVIVPDFDPSLFISYISKASYVCTNSFHCSAFSIIFKRNFMFVPGMRNKRVETLQTVFNLGDRFASYDRIDNLTLDDLHIKYSSNSGDDFIDSSKDFLLHALKK